MGKEQVIFYVVFSSFVVVAFSFAGISLLPKDIGGVVESQCADNGCNEEINEEGFKITFPEDGIPTTNEDLQRYPEIEGPNQEEWTSILSDLDDGKEPEYMRHHGMVIRQVMTGIYNYSYGNDGNYKNKLFGKIQQRGRRGHYSSIYYQIAEGEVGKGLLHYISGFVLYRFYHFSLSGRGTTTWHGRERGLYFNKNRDGSYTVFGYSDTGSEGKAVVKRKDTIDITTCSISVLNTTTFARKTLISSNLTLDYNGKEELLTGILQAVTGPVDQTAAAKTGLPHDKDKNNPQNQHYHPLSLQNSGFSFNTTLTFKGYYPRGSGDFRVSAKGKIRSSEVNTTLVISGKGHRWIRKKALSNTNLRTLFDSNFQLPL